MLKVCRNIFGYFQQRSEVFRKNYRKICVSRLDVFDRNLTHLTQKKLAGIVWTLKMTSLWYNLFFNSLNSCVWFSKKLQQKWTSRTVNLIEGNKLQTFFKVYILTIMGTKSKYSTIYKTTCLWLMGPLEFWTFWRHVYIWFRRVKTSWKTVMDLSRGNHTKCPKFQNLQYYCKFYPGYLVTRTGDREICAVSIRVTNG